MTFICMGIAALVIKGSLTEQLNNGCSQDHGVVRYLDDIYIQGASIICSSECKCDADSTLWPEETANLMHTESSGVDMITQCPDDQISTYDEAHYLALLQFIEVEFNCAGICSTASFYLFSDVG